MPRVGSMADGRRERACCSSVPVSSLHACPRGARRDPAARFSSVPESSSAGPVCGGALCGRGAGTCSEGQASPVVRAKVGSRGAPRRPGVDRRAFRVLQHPGLGARGHIANHGLGRRPSVVDRSAGASSSRASDHDPGGAPQMSFVSSWPLGGGERVFGIEAPRVPARVRPRGHASPPAPGRHGRAEAFALRPLGRRKLEERAQLGNAPAERGVPREIRGHERGLGPPRARLPAPSALLPAASGKAHSRLRKGKTAAWPPGGPGKGSGLGASVWESVWGKGCLVPCSVAVQGRPGRAGLPVKPGCHRREQGSGPAYGDVAQRRGPSRAGRRCASVSSSGRAAALARIQGPASSAPSRGLFEAQRNGSATTQDALSRFRASAFFFVVFSSCTGCEPGATRPATATGGARRRS